MELIPILSLIILVATMSTFILAIGAYILYKVRERKGVTSQAAQPAALPAELLAPAPLLADQRMTPDRRSFDVPMQEFGYEYQRQPAHPTHGEQARGPELRPTFVGTSPPTYGERYQKPTGETPRNYEQERTTPKKKFMRYTNEGYVEPLQQPDRKQEDNLKWR